jgi:hypothetical protein
MATQLPSGLEPHCNIHLNVDIVVSVGTPVKITSFAPLFLQPRKIVAEAFLVYKWCRKIYIEAMKAAQSSRLESR